MTMFSDNMSGEKRQQVADLIARLGLVDADQPTTAAQVNRMITHQLLQDPVRAAIYRWGWDDRTADIQRTLQLQPRSTRVPPTTTSRPPTTPARPPQRATQRSPQLPAPRPPQLLTPSFERVIKISKEKRSSKIMDINTAHNKSKLILQDMIKKFDDYWLVKSENDMNVQYKVEKFQSFDDCALKCEECQICVHSYKCSCMNNTIYLNICKHLHACVKTEFKIPTQIDKNIVPKSNDLEVDNSFIQIHSDKINKKDSKIKNKLEIMCGMYNCSNLNEEDQNFVLKQCDKIISTLSRGSRFKKPINETPKKKKIEPQTRFWAKQKVQNHQPAALSSTEAKLIRQSLKNVTKTL
ncbi:hypothetical protein ACI65C_013275 [Semiaphis heraclei]